MNHNHLLLGAACLLISGTAFGQFKIVYGSEGRSSSYSQEASAIATYSTNCRRHSDYPSLYPEPEAANIIEESTGKATPIDCSSAKKMLEAHNARKQQETKQKIAQKAEADAGWEVQVQQKNGSWRSSYKKSTEDRARYFAGIECLKWKSPIRIVDTASGREHALYCDPRVGKITVDGKPAPVVLLTEPEAGQRAKEVKAQCRSNAFMSAMLDCDCIEKNAKAELLQSEARVGVDAILKKVTHPVSNECVSRTNAYAWTRSSCVSVMEAHRPHDVEEFCSCTADATASGFVKDPTLNLAHYERLRKAAMKQCGLGKKAG